MLELVRDLNASIVELCLVRELLSLFVLLVGFRHVCEGLGVQTLIATPDTVTNCKKITGHTFGRIMIRTLMVPFLAQPDDFCCLHHLRYTVRLRWLAC
jgi:hypothetical protein